MSQTAGLVSSDLYIVIDTSQSMEDEAKALSTALSTALEQARQTCPSDLNVVFLGIEGTFPDTVFDKTVHEYLTENGASGAKFKSRKKGSLPSSGAQEDSAYAIEDVIHYAPWRPGAQKNVFILTDEGPLAGGLKVTDQSRQALNDTIKTALDNDTKVFSYLGTTPPEIPYASKADEKAMIAEYQRLAEETGGESYTFTKGINGFVSILTDAICSSQIPQDESLEEEELPPADKAPDDAKTPPETTNKPDTDSPNGDAAPGGNSGSSDDICSQASEIIRAVNTLADVLKGLVEACGHDGGCHCHEHEPEAPPAPTHRPCKCQQHKPAPAPPPAQEKPAVDPEPEKETPAAKPAPEPEKETPYTELDSIYAITYYDNAFTGSQGDNGDIYQHNGGSGDLVKKSIDNQHGSGWSNATTSDGTHYFGWKGNQIYRQKEGEKFQYLRGLSGGDSKDAFAFRKDDQGYFLSAREGGKIYTFKHPETKYSTVQVRNAAGNAVNVFTNDTKVIDIAFDADDRCYMLDSSGRLWRVDDTHTTDWQAKYLCQFASVAGAGEQCSYFGLAFNTKGQVYLSGGIRSNGQAKRFIARTRLDTPDEVKIIYDGGWGSASYGNLSSRAYPKLS